MNAKGHTLPLIDQTHVLIRLLNESMGYLVSKIQDSCSPNFNVSADTHAPEQVLPVDDGLHVVGEFLLHQRQP